MRFAAVTGVQRTEDRIPGRRTKRATRAPTRLRHLRARHTISEHEPSKAFRAPHNAYSMARPRSGAQNRPGYDFDAG